MIKPSKRGSRMRIGRKNKKKENERNPVCPIGKCTCKDVESVAQAEKEIK